MRDRPACPNAAPTWKRFLPSGLTLLAGLAVSGWVFAQWRHQEAADFEADFGHRATNAILFLKTRNASTYLESGLRRLESAAALLSRDPWLAREEFAPLRGEPFFFDELTHDAEWVPAVKGPDRRAFEARAREATGGDYRIREWAPGGDLIEAAERDLYFPVLYLEQSRPSANPWAGLDLNSVPIFAEAMDLAIGTRMPVLAGRIPLDRQLGRQIDFRLFQPVFRGGVTPRDEAEASEALLGFATQVTRAEVSRAFLEFPEEIASTRKWYLENLKDTLLNQLPGTSGGIDVRVHQIPSDPHIDDEPQIEVTHRAGPWSSAAAAPIGPGWTARGQFETGGRAWSLVATPREALVAAHSSRRPWFAAAIGLAITLLLTGLQWQTGSKAARVRQLVEDRTRQLSEANRELENQVATRKAAESALRQRSAVLSNVIANIPVYVYWKDAQSVYQGCNALYAKAAGLDSPAAIVGKTDFDLAWAETNAEFFRQCDRRVIESGEPLLNVEVKARMAGETERELLINKVPLRNSQGGVAGVLGIDTDISHIRHTEAENESLQRQLRQVQKMEAVGTLAGGIAHDFNNLLTGILGYAGLLRERPGDTESVLKAAEVIETAASRAKTLTGQLLGFARQGKHQVRPIDLNETINEVLGLLSRTFNKNVTIERRFTGAPAGIKGDPDQMQQVFVNLALNAHDAMPEGGTLVFQTERVELDQVYCRAHPGAVEGAYICAAVRDTGCGFAPEIADRLFEPFFTTKEPGKGTGMGLAMVYGIVKNHGGSIRAYSEPGHGACMKVYIPAVEMTAPAPATARPRAEPTQGTGRILVVDDEAVVRDLATDMLTLLGYDVVTAADGVEALEYFTEHAAQIDLAIVDMIMPRMGGRDCFLAMKRIDPQVRAILSTGFTRDDAAQEILDEGMAGFAQKPYTLKQLSEIVARAMN